MSIIVTNACINCDACISVCPNNGISRGEYKVTVDAALCTECVGFSSSEQCVDVCPVNVCVRDAKNVATEEALFERAKRIHADSPIQPSLTPETSHFRVAKIPRSRWWERLVPSLRNTLVDEPERNDV